MITDAEKFEASRLAEDLDTTIYENDVTQMVGFVGLIFCLTKQAKISGVPLAVIQRTIAEVYDATTIVHAPVDGVAKA